MRTQTSPARRLRTAALAIILAATSFAVTATPGPITNPSSGFKPLDAVAGLANRLFAPPRANAGWCADNAAFTGYLTSSPNTHTKLTRTKSAHVFAYASDVVDDWSCTAYYRYDGVAWNKGLTRGRFDWGVIISSTSVPCNYVVGSNDFLKANPTTDCDDSDAEYAHDISLTAERVYEQDNAHDSEGDLGFIHSDCGTLYGGGDGEAQSGTEADPETFTAGNAANRPGANCDPTVLDGFSVSQTLVYDKTDPSRAFTNPASNVIRQSGSYNVQFDVSDAVAGFGGTKGWVLKRQVADLVGPGDCDDFVDEEYDLLYPTTGVDTTQGSKSQSQTLVSGRCYQWVLTATDQNDNAADDLVSATVTVDDSTPVATFLNPMTDTSSARNTSPYTVTWTETTFGSAIASRSFQRQKATISSGACGSFSNDGSATNTASGASVALTNNTCYKWLLTITDSAGRTSSQATSGTILYNTSWPAADFGTVSNPVPNEGTTTALKNGTLNVDWTETWGSGGSAHGSTPRSLQRQTGAVVTTNSCAGMSWANDGAAFTSAAPKAESTFTNGNAYRWIQTLKNNSSTTGAVTSGCVIWDTTAPTATLTAPAANAAIMGSVTITGTASDATSFNGYTLEYGSGASPSSWTTIGTYTKAVTSGTLGTWSPGSLSGVYSIRLSITDAAGNAATSVQRTVVLENARRGEESYTTRVPYDLGGGWALDVGVANGEARLSRELFSIPSYGPDQSLALSYSSLESSATGKFGVGWHSNLTQYLTFDVASNITTWHRADGGRVPFGNVGGTWTPANGHYETMSVGGSEVTITTKDQTRYVFEDTGAGRLKRVLDRFGNALTIVWSASGATVTDDSGRGPASGETYNITYDSGNARISAFKDFAGRTWSFSYSGTGASSLLTCVTDPASKVTRLGYTSSVLTSITRGTGASCSSGGNNAWAIAYSSSKVSSVTTPEVASPDLFTYAAKTTTWREVYDETGPGYADTVFTLDAARGFVLKRGWPINEPGDELETTGTTWTYDEDGNRLTESAPNDPDSEPTVEYAYDANGNMTSEGRVIQRGSPDITVTTLTTYNATNDVVTRTDADNDTNLRVVTKYTYDGSGHLTSENRNCTTSGTTAPAQGAGGTCTGAGTQNASTNVITNYAYTANDQLEFQQDPLGRVTKHIYDSHGNETSIIANCTSSGTTQPSLTGCTTTNSGNGGTHNADTNVITTQTFNTGVAAGKAGLVTSSDDALGRTTTYTYDSLGRRLTEVLPGDSSIPALTRTTTYDEYGNVLTEADSWTPSGGSLQTRTTTHTYDLEQRETEVLDPAGTATVTSYDEQDNTVREVVKDGNSSDTATVTEWDYDLAGNQVEEALLDEDASAAVATEIDVDEAGEVTETTAAGVEIAYERDLDGRILGEATSEVTEQTLLFETATTYDLLGRETGFDDADAGTSADITRTYDALGRLLTIAENGRTTTYTYDRAGNQVTITDAATIVATSSYDALNRPTVVTANDVVSGSDPDDDVTTTTYYDAAGNAIAVKDPNGVTTRTIVNVRDLPYQTIANCTDSGTTKTTTPASCVGAGTHNNVTNVVSEMTYDGQARTVKAVSADGLAAETTTEAQYDNAGRVLRTVDARGTITLNVYNDQGQLTDTYVNCTTSLTTIPNPWTSCTGAGSNDGTYNLHTIYTYDAFGNQATVEAPNDRLTHYVYDDDNRLSAVIENYVDGSQSAADDITTTYVYDEAGRQGAVIRPTPSGSATTVTRTLYNDDGTVAQVIVNCTTSGTSAPTSVIDILACDGDGTKDADTNLITDNAYNAKGELIAVTAPDPSTADGTRDDAVTQYAYDAVGRLCRVVENTTGGTDLQALGNPCLTGTQGTGTATANVSTRYTYDGVGRLQSMVDARGNTTTYTYDAAGHETGRVDDLGKSLIWRYDDIGNRINQNNRTDSIPTNSVVWTYDPFGRVLTRVADSVTTTYTYDLNGNKLTAGDGTYTITATYDRLNRVLTVDDEDAGSSTDTSYTYSFTAPAWTDVTGTYGGSLDKFERLTMVNDPASSTNYNWSYGTGGQVLSGVQGNDNTVTNTFDNAGRMTRSLVEDATVDRADYVYTYNRAGQVLSELAEVGTDPADGTVSYAYDPLGRLTGSTLSGTTTAYAWDATTNRTSVQVGAGTAATTSYNDANRPTSGANPSATYGSDHDGRLTARPNQTMIWDKLGRLKQVKNAAGTVTIATYTYDPMDRLRTVDYGGGNKIRFRYTGLTTSAAQWIDDVAGTVTRSIGNSWNGEHLLDWTGSSSNRRYYGTNAHHDVTWLATDTGTIIDSLRYDPWGTPRSAIPSGYTPFRFQGSWHDAITTDLAWVVTRWYAPSLGRFISEDTLLGQPVNPGSRHLYAYAEGDPVAGWDPDGRAYIGFNFSDSDKYCMSEGFGKPNRTYAKVSGSGTIETQAHSEDASSSARAQCRIVSKKKLYWQKPAKNVSMSLRLKSDYLGVSGIGGAIVGGWRNSVTITAKWTYHDRTGVRESTFYAYWGTRECKQVGIGEVGTPLCEGPVIDWNRSFNRINSGSSDIRLRKGAYFTVEMTLLVKASNWGAGSWGETHASMEAPHGRLVFEAR